MATISTHSGDKLSFEHNIRDPHYTDPQKHIDPSLTKYNQTFVNEEFKSHEKIINDFFAEDTENYNESKRKDRQIKNYYQHIVDRYEREENRIKKNPTVRDKKGVLHKRTNRQPKVQREMIIGVYPKGNDEISREQKIKIQKHFIKIWQRTMPDIKILGAYCHCDEPKSDIHTHVDYTTISTGFKQGMERQISGDKCFNKTIHELVGKTFDIELDGQNYHIDFSEWKAPSYAKRDNNDQKMTPVKYWTSMANWMLEQVCVTNGIEVQHPQRGRNVPHKETPQYKIEKEIEEKEAVLAEKKAQLMQLKAKSKKSKKNLKNKIYLHKLEKRKKQLTNLQEQSRKLNQELYKKKKIALCWKKSANGYLGKITDYLHEQKICWDPCKEKELLEIVDGSWPILYLLIEDIKKTTPTK